MQNRLAQLGNEKNKVLMKLVESQKLCKALKYAQRDFLEQPDVDPYSLFYTRIFPYRYVPDGEKDQASFITMEFDNFHLVRNAIKCAYIYVYSLVHQDIIGTDYGWTRTDYLSSQIDQQLNQMRLGVGKISFYDTDVFILNGSFYGRCNVYKYYGFN